MLGLGNGSRFLDADQIANPALIFGVVDVEAGQPTHLLVVQAMALLPSHFHYRRLVLLNPYHRSGANLAPVSLIGIGDNH